MKNTLRQLKHSKQFMVGFVILLAVFLTVIIYPLIVVADPLEMVGRGTFFKPGTYISVQDAISKGMSGQDSYTLNIDASAGRLAATLSLEDREAMVSWLVKYGGVDENAVGTSDDEVDALLELWDANYDEKNPQKGLIAAKKKYYVRLNKSLQDLKTSAGIIIANEGEEGLTKISQIGDQQYVNVKDMVPKRTFILGTDNFGRDVLTELVAATKTSLIIGLIAGVVATMIGLLLGLFAGFLGGVVDDFIMFVTNLFTVIPSFVILILISYSVGTQARGVRMVAIIIGLTSWPWTTRSVRSQVISLRNRDHVNMSRLSGHSLLRIVLIDILPYVASYVVMAFILQISSGILAESQLSMLGLGPATTSTATLGLMMNWAMTYTAHLNGSWWAYFPVILIIALISFSLNLMNTGLDQVFNPTLRD